MQRLRVFLSSPGDVSDERGIALTAIDRLQYEPMLRGKVFFEVASWDKPGAGAPMLATLTPQSSIDHGMPRPSDCDIVAVIFWARMGTPLPYPEYQKENGQPYSSGTEWEFEDGLRGTSQVLLYRRTADVLFKATDPDRDERLRQFDLVEEFFRRLRDPKTGAILHGYKSYQTPEEFRVEFESDLRELVHRLVVDFAVQPIGATSPPLWQGSPFPGLRAFTPHDAPIFFGRGREADELISRVSGSRFVAVVGASGSGKSSLVGAGLIPRLSERGWLLPEYNPRSNQWEGLRFTPGELGDNPFLALAVKLAPLVGGVAREIAKHLSASPMHVTQYLSVAVVANTEAMVFIDQFEELFTVVSDSHLDDFFVLLQTIANAANARVVVTIRSDFYHRCVEIPALATLLEHGQFPLSAPSETLLDMIMRPADRAGLQFEDGLVGRILNDTGQHPGALPLLAYTLDELYRTSGSTQMLSQVAYERLGGVRGAIGTRAEDVFRHRLDENTRATFSKVFRELVDIDEQGQATRRRVPLPAVATDEHARRLIDVYTEARLLVRSGEPGREPDVFVAHEALFVSWSRLREWIELTQDDLRLLRKVRAAAQEWDAAGRVDAYLWQHERLAPVWEMINRLDPAIDRVLAEFIHPEYERLLKEFQDPALETYRRQMLIDRLVTIGEASVPGLVSMLTSEVTAVRTAAATALGRLGQAAIPNLLDAAVHPNADVRLAVMVTLRQMGDERAIFILEHALHDHDERVRSLANGALAALGGPQAAAVLAAAAADVDVDVRWRAVGSLGAFGEVAVGPLLLSLRDNDSRVRTDALAALRAICATDVGPLLTALRDPDASVRVTATEALGSLDETAVPGLRIALEDEDADVRWRAKEALSALGAVAPIQVLVEELASTEDGIAVAAADALVRHGPPAVEPLLDVLLRGKPDQVRVLAAHALARLEQPGAMALLSALHDPGLGVWLRAMDALITCFNPPTEQVLALVHVQDSRVQEAAVTILSAINTLPMELPRLQHDPDPTVRRALATGLASSVTKTTQSALLSMLSDEDALTREAAARSVGSIGASLLPQLFRLMQKSDTVTRTATGLALRIISGEAVPGLLTLVHDEDVVTRDLAIAVLADIGTAAALFGLAELGIRVDSDLALAEEVNNPEVQP